jgi:hypothetical protein
MNVSTQARQQTLSAICGLGVSLLARRGLSHLILKYPTLGAQLPLWGRVALASMGSVATGIATALVVHRVLGRSQAPAQGQSTVVEQPPVDEPETPVEPEPLTLDNLVERFPHAAWGTFRGQHAVDVSNVADGAATLLSCQGEVDWGQYYLAKVTLDQCDDAIASELFEKFPTLNLIRAGKDAWFNTNKAFDDPTRLDAGKVHISEVKGGGSRSAWDALRETHPEKDDWAIIRELSRVAGVPLTSYLDGDAGAFLLVIDAHDPISPRPSLPLRSGRVFEAEVFPNTCLTNFTYAAKGQDSAQGRRIAHQTIRRLPCVPWLFLHRSDTSYTEVSTWNGRIDNDSQMGILSGPAPKVGNSNDLGESAIFHAYYDCQNDRSPEVRRLGDELRFNVGPILKEALLRSLGEEDIRHMKPTTDAKGFVHIREDVDAND